MFSSKLLGPIFNLSQAYIFRPKRLIWPNSWFQPKQLFSCLSLSPQWLKRRNGLGAIGILPFPIYFLCWLAIIPLKLRPLSSPKHHYITVHNLIQKSPTNFFKHQGSLFFFFFFHSICIAFGVELSELRDEVMLGKDGYDGVQVISRTWHQIFKGPIIYGLELDFFCCYSSLTWIRARK